MGSGFQGNKKKHSIGFSYAWNGIKHLAATEKNFQRQLIAALVTIVLGFTFQISRLEWLYILLTIALVLSLEMINTAVEKTIDYLAPDFHPSAGLIKDISAGAVLVAAAVSIIIGTIIFTPKIFSLFF